ncbi:MAG: dephospho-CoA kinase [Bacillota bacterium]|jgi:dephospho-CoA kinase|nr:dephospho-CoA kinase [Bacillota bacterium]HHU30196.1 dephospho-CoA kinase [Bacillota bacterium]
MLIVGLTGGIATGKSTVAAMFAKMGIRRFDADSLAREAVEPGTAALQEIARTFGSAVIDDQGRLDRKKMAGIVFNDAGKRKQLEGIIHPRVRLLLEERLAAARRAGDCLVLVEVPLLYETNFQRFVDKVIVVRVSEQQQLMRLRQRDGLSLAEAKRRIAAQMPLEEKAALADYVIDNGGTLAETEKQARQILGRLLEECSHA